jgi:bifunctional non-homologous end joining protein LigD
LHALLERNHDKHLREGEVLAGDGPKHLARLVAAGHEGLVSKRAESKYRHGRSDDWRKCRPRAAEELAIVGYTDPRGSRVGLGALVLGRRSADGKWHYVGRAGSGLPTATLHELAATLQKIARKAPPVVPASIPADNRELRRAHWVEPRFVVEVEYRGHSKDGVLRMPTVKAVRLDKNADDLAEPDDRDLGVKVSHGERVVYPKVGYTKAEVFGYYRAVASCMLAEIARRPLAIVRCPSGVEGKSFFQKHVTPGLGPHVLGIDIVDTDGKTKPTLYVEDAIGLLELVQMNALEVHAWGTHIDDLERCDRLVFDLDPADDVPWPDVVAAAELVRKILEQAGLRSYVRTSGGKGLHVVLPISPAPWDEAKEFAHRFAEAMAHAQPDRYIAVMSKSRRNGKIFVDYLRNGRGATSVASYSLRRNPNATVAMPIAWRELGKLAGARAFDLKRAMDVVRTRKHDPWEGIADLQQRLPKVK